MIFAPIAEEERVPAGAGRGRGRCGDCDDPPRFYGLEKQNLLLCCDITIITSFACVDSLGIPRRERKDSAQQLYTSNKLPKISISSSLCYDDAAVNETIQMY